MHVFMTTYDDVIDKQSLLATPVWERWPTETCFGGWVEQTVADILLTRASMNGDNVLKLLSRTMEDILNIFSNNLNDWMILLCINLPLDLLLYYIVGFQIFLFYKVV